MHRNSLISASRFALSRRASLASTALTRGLKHRPTAFNSRPSSGQFTLSRRWATSTTLNSTATDPAEVEALSILEEGTKKLEEGDVEGAKSLYQRSVQIRRSASALFNLGVTHYHSKDFPAAIEAWKESIELQPSSPDAHTNLASAYIMSSISRPNLAIKHLKIASTLAPDDPEILFNTAAVLEATGNLEESLKYYKKSHEYGVEKASIHIRNVSAKILGKLANEAPPTESEKDKA